MMGISDIKTMLVVILIVAVGGLGLYSKSLVAEKATLAKENASLAAEASSYRSEAKYNLEALNAREIESNRIMGEKQALAKQLQDVINANEETKLWADTVCPDGVIDCLLK